MCVCWAKEDIQRQSIRTVDRGSKRRGGHYKDSAEGGKGGVDAHRDIRHADTHTILCSCAQHGLPVRAPKSEAVVWIQAPKVFPRDMLDVLLCLLTKNRKKKV